MVFEVYNIGDGQYLYRVCNAAAMLANDGLLTDVALVGFMLGIIAVCIRAIMTGGRDFGIPTILMGIVLFMLLFGNRATVVITDMYDQPDGMGPQVRAVDNVPWGAAAMASIISRIGFSLTEKFEQAFGTPGDVGITAGGFARPLELLASVRQLTDANSAGSKHLQGFSASIELYVDQCTLPAMDQGLRDATPASLFNDPNPLHGIYHDPAGTQGGLWYTQSFLAPDGSIIHDGTPVTVDCQEAFSRLEGFYGGALLPAVDEALQPRFGANATERVREALAGLGSSAAEDMQAYTAALVIARSYDRAASGGSVSNPHQAAADMLVTSAVDQRFVQWSAEHDLFQRVAQPMMSFFSALIFCLAPFMAFLLGLGPLGLSLLMRYTLLGIWVALWPVTIAIVQLFYNTQAENFIDRIDLLGTATDTVAPIAPTSIQSVAMLTDQAAAWIGSASTLAASTPALTLMLIFGGAVTATYLAGRLQGGDHANEKLMSPDAMQPGPALATSAGHSYNPTEGLTRSGAGGMLPSINLGEIRSTAMASSSQESSGVAESYLSNVQRTWGESGGLGKNYGEAMDYGFRNSSDQAWTRAAALAGSYGINLGSDYATSTSGSDSTDMSHGFTFDGKGGVNGSMGGDRARGVNLNESGGGNGKWNKVASRGTKLARTVLSNVSGGLLADISSKSSATDSESAAQAVRILDGLSSDQRTELRNALTAALASGMSRNGGELANYGLSENQAQQLAKSSSETAQSLEQYSETRGLTFTAGTSQSMSIATAGKQFVHQNGEGSGQRLYNEVRGALPDADVAGFLQQLNGRVSGDSAYAGAAILALDQYRETLGDRNGGAVPAGATGAVAWADARLVEAMSDSGFMISGGGASGERDGWQSNLGLSGAGASPRTAVEGGLPTEVDGAGVLGEARAAVSAGTADVAAAQHPSAATTLDSLQNPREFYSDGNRQVATVVDANEERVRNDGKAAMLNALGKSPNAGADAQSVPEASGVTPADVAAGNFADRLVPRSAP